MPFPTFEEMDAFVEGQGSVTTKKLIKHYNMTGNASGGIMCEGKRRVFVYGTTQEFAVHIHNYIKRDNVKLDTCMLTVVATDGEVYTPSDGEEYIPMLISVRRCECGADQ
jgi:hypothetical protein